MAEGASFAKPSVIVGTHTHCPSADHQVLPRGTAFQSDAGMGPHDHPADALVPAPRSGIPRSEEVRFAMDSPLEESGFEPSVPLSRKFLPGCIPLKPT